VSYKGRVKNGLEVLPPEVKLPEGAEVKVEPLELLPEEDPFLQAALKVAKPRPHWPKDYTRNLDYYLYGVPTRS
jgi:hypothetical protein